MTDEQLKEALLNIPHVMHAVVRTAMLTGTSVSSVADDLVVRLRATNIPKTRRKVEEALRHSEALTYHVAVELRIISDPVIG